MHQKSLPLKEKGTCGPLFLLISRSYFNYTCPVPAPAPAGGVAGGAGGTPN